MKRMLCAVLCAALLLGGCASADVTPDETEVRPEAETDHAAESMVDVTQIQVPSVTFPKEGQENEAITPEQTGGVRVTYSGNVSSVRYITDPEQLPDHEALAGYDEAYFETGALVLVMESVSSGSVEVGIESIAEGVVTLSHHMPGDAGTTDMATWMLWAEVETGLDWTWSVANPALESNTSTF